MAGSELPNMRPVAKALFDPWLTEKAGPGTRTLSLRPSARWARHSAGLNRPLALAAGVGCRRPLRKGPVVGVVRRPTKTLAPFRRVEQDPRRSRLAWARSAGSQPCHRAANGAFRARSDWQVGVRNRARRGSVPIDLLVPRRGVELREPASKLRQRASRQRRDGLLDRLDVSQAQAPDGRRCCKSCGTLMDHASSFAGPASPSTYAAASAPRATCCCGNSSSHPGAWLSSEN